MVSGLLLAGGLLLVLFLGGIPLDVVLGLAVAVASWELAGLAARCGVPPAPAVLYPLGQFLVFRFLLPAGFPALEWALGSSAVLGLLTGVVRGGGPAGAAGGGLERGAALFVRWAVGVGGALYLGLCLGYYLALMRWHGAPDADRFGLRIVVVTLTATMLGDTVALLAGRALGRHRFFPRISPHKTVEGAVGGALSSVVVVTLGMPTLTGMVMWQAVLLGIAVAVAAQGGDLAESALKRAAGAKDSSSLIPGHGGLLDRLDSLLLVGPVVYSFLRLVSLA